MDPDKIKMMLFNMELLIDAMKKETQEPRVTQEQSKPEQQFLQEVPQYEYRNLPIEDYDEVFDPRDMI
jgi:hypothetical protein